MKHKMSVFMISRGYSLFQRSKHFTFCLNTCDFLVFYNENLNLYPQ